MILTLVGSRVAPVRHLSIAKDLGRELGKRGHFARSGGAIGMDSAWLEDYDPSLTVVYRNDYKLYHPHKTVSLLDLPPDIEHECISIARSVVPWLDDLSYYGRTLHARNVLQLLGDDLQSPSDLVIYYAKEHNGNIYGGTRTAVLLANRYKIPTSNLFHEKEIDRWCNKLGVDPRKPVTTQSLDFLENSC